MFVGINVYIFETKPCLWGLISAVQAHVLSGCVNLMFAGYLFLRFKDGGEVRQINSSQTLMKLQYTLIYYTHAYFIHATKCSMYTYHIMHNGAFDWEKCVK